MSKLDNPDERTNAALIWPRKIRSIYVFRGSNPALVVRISFELSHRRRVHPPPLRKKKPRIPGAFRWFRCL